MLPYYDVWAWPLRTGLACALASLIYLSPVDQQGEGIIEARILGPASAVICSALMLGQSVRTAWFFIRGAILGGAIGAALVNFLLAVGWTMPVVVYVMIGAASMLVLRYPMPAIQQKSTWALVTVGTAALIQQGKSVDRL